MTHSASDHLGPNHPPGGTRAATGAGLDPGALAEGMVEEMAWLRRLARALARDDAAADDLVQDTLSVAIRRSAPIRNLRGFLAGTLRRLAVRSWREETRRGAREAARPALDAEALPGADELAERVDLLRAVLEELESLPPSQRRVVSLRFLQDMTADEIASRTGSAPATVRAHLARGLASLRARLDDRTGGRDGWALAIGAWASGDATIRKSVTTVHGGLRGEWTGARAVPSIAANGVMIMATWKLAALVAAPVLAATVWVITSGAPGGAVLLDHSAPDEPAAAAELSALPENRARGAPPVPAEVDLAAAEAPSDPAGRVVSDELHPIVGTVVDALTREPVPFLDLEWSQYGASDAAPGPIQAVTDATGAFAVADVLLPAGSLEFVARDGTELGRRSRIEQSVELPLAGPLEVAVGPTFALDLVGGDGANRDTLLVEFAAAGTEPGMSRYMTGLRPGPGPVAAARGASWVRFPAGVTALDAAADREVVVSDGTGFWLGRAAVTRTAGIEPAPIEVRLEARGAVEFRLAADDGAQRPGARVDLVEPGTGVTRRVFFGEHSRDGTARGVGRCLAAGTYRWTTVPGESTGEIEVKVGQTVVVEISPDQLGAVFDTYVAIDTAACPAANPSDWLVLVAREDEPSTGFMARPSRVEAAGGPAWRIELPGLPDGRWTVAISADASVELDASVVRVGLGDPPPTVVVRPAEARVAVSVLAVDATSGAAIPGAEAAYLVTPQDSGELTREAEGGFEPALVRRGAAVTFCVRAPGYQLTTATVEPAEDGVVHTVRLERGWRGRVVVVDVMAQELLTGVNVLADGRPAGATDASGSLWIEGKGPPRRLDISSPDANLEVLTSPMDAPEGLAVEPILGWVFAVIRS